MDRQNGGFVGEELDARRILRDWMAPTVFRRDGQKCAVDSKTAEDCGGIRSGRGDEVEVCFCAFARSDGEARPV
jgi:hypothetical protein